MAHVAANAVKETTTTTGTGNLTLAGAVSTFQTFASECSNNDTFFYRVAHQSANEWEIGYGTYVSATPAIARTTIIESSNAGAAVNFSAGTKDVLIVSPSMTATWGVLNVSPSTNQDNYSPTGLGNCSSLWMNIGATMKLTGLAGGYEGRKMIIRNESTDYLLILEHLSSSSSSANQFRLRNGFPLFLMPHDFAEFIYCSHSKWELVNQNSPGVMGLTHFSDMFGATSAAAPTTSGSVGGFPIHTAGTGATAQASTYLANTTERPMGIIQIDTGTTTTGRAVIGSNGTDDIIPTLGPALSVARLAVETTVSGTETFQVFSGFIDVGAAGATTDGVCWNNRWTGAAAEWAQDRYAAASRTGTTTGSPTPDNNYIWLVVFVNDAWTRADFIYSTDSVSFTIASSPTTGFPSSTQRTAWCGAAIVKSAGTTARNVSVDLAGFRVDYVRG